MWRHSPHHTHARGGEISWALCITGEIFNHFPRKVIFATIQKTPSEMDVAPWIANWILMVSDGITWHLIVLKKRGNAFI